MTPPSPERPSTGRVPRPPIYHLAGAAQSRGCGDHSHDTWYARAVHADIAGQSLPMIVKRIPSPVVAAVEIACGLAARELRLNVPMPGLVVAEREDLPDLDEDVPGQRFLLVGSHYQRPDALFAEVVANHPAAEELIWDRVCGTLVARQGAAWDELIANPDRHSENLLFDGSTWWLFDHDQALAPAAQYVADESDQQKRLEALAFNASENQLVEQLKQRLRDEIRAILEQSRRFDAGARRLQSLAHYSREWKHTESDIQHLLGLVSIILGLIHLRLPALAEKLHHRLEQPFAGHPNLWTSLTQKP